MAEYIINIIINNEFQRHYTIKKPLSCGEGDRRESVEKEKEEGPHCRKVPSTTSDLKTPLVMQWCK
jgi:hypothetical protein